MSTVVWRRRAVFPIVVLDGPRAVGKTTTATRVAASVIELPRDSERLSIDPEAFLADLPGPVLIDEWQLAAVADARRRVENGASPLEVRFRSIPS